MKRNRIILGHSYWGRGGAEIAVMWLLQALCGEYQIDIVTRGGWDLDDLNRCAGTKIKQNQLGEVIYPPLIPRENGFGGALWNGLFLRFCRYVAPRYDHCITASRVIDWSCPAIHFLSDVVWNVPLQKRFGCAEAVRSSGIFRRVYVKAGEWLAGASDRDPTLHDVFVANSEWTAAISAQYCASRPLVIYPVVPECEGISSWEKRENGFLCLGRISPEKKIEQVIAIMDQVRELGHQVRLHLAGSGDEYEYETQIRQLCELRSDWIVFHGALYGPDKEELLERCRYGISACDREAFGIATVEMVKAGVIPFVPVDGAQSEIVEDSSLVYRDIEDAAMKIDAVLNSEALQVQQHEAMLRRGTEFTPEHFCVAVRELVNRELMS